MNPVPLFPDFKPLDLDDREIINHALWQYQPETSELTFTNLFIWRGRYHFRWCFLEDWLLLISDFGNDGLYALEPVGPPPRIKPVHQLLSWLCDQADSDYRIDRADSRLVDELTHSNSFTIEPIREHYDYLYSTNDLISLAGRHFHSKRNHLTRFLKKKRVTYKPFTAALAPDCLKLATSWSKFHQFRKGQALIDELVAIREALLHFDELHLLGAAICIEGHVEAFTLGEMLNEKTAVIHVEKASPQIHGIYTAINQMFCAHDLKNTVYVNREQDLGDEGLRKAKLSYHPVRLIEKFRIRMEC